jgi:hypothetical protein
LLPLFCLGLDFAVLDSLHVPQECPEAVGQHETILIKIFSEGVLWLKGRHHARGSQKGDPFLSGVP